MKSGLMLALLACTPALAVSQTIRCSDKIIGTGSSRFEVASLCGDPAQVDHKTVYNSISGATPGPSGLLTGSSLEVQVELWTYNFGPNKLMQRILFEDGVVVRIESLGYGF